MAVYEFECQTCGARFQVTMPMHEHDQVKEQPPQCPQCGAQQTRQLVSHFECKTPSGS